MSKDKAHIRYRNKDNKIVVGTTTVLSVLNKAALVPWANKLGLAGIDVKAYVDDKAAIGTLTHYLIQCHLSGEQPDTSDYSRNQIEQAENCMLSYLEWERNNPVTPILLETPLVSEQYQFGGTIDIYCELSGKKVLIDLKTSKACYPEHKTQVVAYKTLLEENDYDVNGVHLLRIGRDETEGFEFINVDNMELHWKLFEHCLEVYRIKKLTG